MPRWYIVTQDYLLKGASIKVVDPEFTQKLKNGDKDAMSKIVHDYSSHLFKAALGLGFDENESKELTQKTMVKFVEVVHKFEGRSHIRTFLFGIFYNHVHEARRSFKKAQSHDPIDEVAESMFDERGNWQKDARVSSPEKFLEACQTMDIIELCLDKLPIRQKMAFTLKFVDSAETSEICNLLTVSDTNLRQLLFRAKSRLRLCVESHMNK